MTNEYEKVREAILKIILIKLAKSAERGQDIVEILFNGDTVIDITDAILALKKPDGSAMLGVIADDQTINADYPPISAWDKCRSDDANFVKIVEKEKSHETT